MQATENYLAQHPLIYSSKASKTIGQVAQGTYEGQQHKIMQKEIKTIRRGAPLGKRPGAHGDEQ